MPYCSPVATGSSSLLSAGYPQDIIGVNQTFLGDVVFHSIPSTATATYHNYNPVRKSLDVARPSRHHSRTSSQPSSSSAADCTLKSALKCLQATTATTTSRSGRTVPRKATCDAKKVQFAANLEELCYFLYTEEPKRVSQIGRESSTDADKNLLLNNIKKIRNPLPTTTRPCPPPRNPARSRGRTLLPLPHPPQSQPRWALQPLNFSTPRAVKKDEHFPAVKLERCSLVNGDTATFAGVVQVRNYAYQKRVRIRYSTDAWASSSDTDAHYISLISPGESGGDLDRFSFAINLGSTLASDLEKMVVCFCIQYEVNGVEYWDNNDGANYQCCFSRAV